MPPPSYLGCVPICFVATLKYHGRRNASYVGQRGQRRAQTEQGKKRRMPKNKQAPAGGLRKGVETVCAPFLGEDEEEEHEEGDYDEDEEEGEPEEEEGMGEMDKVAHNKYEQLVDIYWK